MLSAVINVLLLGVMLLIITNLVLSALGRLREHRSQQATTNPLGFPVNSLRPRMRLLVRTQEGVLIKVRQPQQAAMMLTLPASWYIRHRTFVSVSLLLMILLTLFGQNALADGGIQNIGKTFSFFSSNQSSDFTTAPLPLSVTPLTASARIVRVDSAARNQYFTDYQFYNWSWSSCSGISMEEVMNAYGHHFIAADVLQEELNLGVWSPYSGLIGGEPSIAQAASHFGFKASPNPPRTLQALIAITNKGFPVIVGIPGHIMVVRGGDSRYIYVVDSAPANRTILTHEQFMSQWDNFSVLLTPR